MGQVSHNVRGKPVETVAGNAFPLQELVRAKSNEILLHPKSSLLRPLNSITLSLMLKFMTSCNEI
jgi:hypothetical protein